MSHLTGTLEGFRYYFQHIDLKDKLILDVGCKDSIAGVYFKNLGLNWTGIDKTPVQPQGEVITMDMTDLKFDAKIFDIVFVCHSLEHCENPIQAIKEFRRVMKDDGYLFISLPCYCKHHILESDEDHIFCFTDWQIIRLLNYCNFEKILVTQSEDGYSQHGLYNLFVTARKNGKA